MKFSIIVGLVACIVGCNSQCTETKAEGRYAPNHAFCAGDLIFDEEFKTLDKDLWRPEQSLSGGGNWEFQWYLDNPRNAYVDNGILHLRPTLTTDVHPDYFLFNGTASIPPSVCTQHTDWGCERTGNYDNIINPIQSSRFSTVNSFYFTYGIVEFRAKLPTGDWLWPALWMMPKYEMYGLWPRSGEIDIMESRGNTDYRQNGVHIGVEQAGASQHFGPNYAQNAYSTAHAVKNKSPGFNVGFHTYRLEWRSSGLKYFYDGELVLDVPVGAGFWARGGAIFGDQENIWKSGTLMAPFDQHFYLIFNLACGGTNTYFPDPPGAVNSPHPKPWSNLSSRAAREFWDQKDNWYSTWKGDESHLQLDYVKVWAV